MEEFKDRLRRSLADAEMSQQELADRTGIGKASISQYANGTYVPEIKKAGMIAKALNVDVLWLLCEDDQCEEVFAPPVKKSAKKSKSIAEKMMHLTSDEVALVEDYMDYLIYRRKKRSH